MTWDAPPAGLLHFQGIPTNLYFPVLLEGGHSNAWRILPTYQSTNTPNKALKPTSRISLKTPWKTASSRANHFPTTQFLCFNSHLQNWGSTRPVRPPELNPLHRNLLITAQIARAGGNRFPHKSRTKMKMNMSFHFSFSLHAPCAPDTDAAAHCLCPSAGSHTHENLQILLI